MRLEARLVDRSIRILPGVKRMIESIPDGHYAVVTNGARNYGKFSYSYDGSFTKLSLFSLWSYVSNWDYSSPSHYYY